MSLSKLRLVCLAVLVTGGGLVARQAAPQPLTDKDRAEIQALVARYAKALSSCASQEYASLFVPDGTFTSDDFRGPRHRAMYGPNGGTLVGRAKLAELVETEEFCLDKSRARAQSSAPPPAVVIVPTAQGASGTINLANNARYEDEYVKTAEGWRFKTRRVVMPPRPPAQPSSSSR